MGGLMIRLGWQAVAMMVTFVAALVVLPRVATVRYTVGSNTGGWATNVNYTKWALGKHFYKDDWLLFVYDRNLMDVLEVNKTDYEHCCSNHPLHNWTTGAGRDVVELNETRAYYFISGKGFCWGGVKLAIHVENHPPPPPRPHKKNSSPPLVLSLIGQIFMPVFFTIAAFLDMLRLLF